MVKLIQTFAGEHEGCYLTIIEADAGQVSAVGKQERSHKDIRGLVVLDRDHLLGFKELIFGRRCGRKRVLRHLFAVVLEPLSDKVWSRSQAMAFFIFFVVAFSIPFKVTYRIQSAASIVFRSQCDKTVVNLGVIVKRKTKGGTDDTWNKAEKT
ncbi:MAG: hypothetical protein GY697_26955 [Desulfobacterales bacterium]|nr:hypothetical protein [Desulfobacterales bacterium]